MTSTSTKFVLTLSCTDRPGLVASVAATLFDSGGNILESTQFNDQESGLFFMRVLFETTRSKVDLDRALDPVASRVGMKWRLRPYEQRQRVLLLVSHLDHCLTDLLYRERIGELAMDVVGIVSNHPREALIAAAPGDRIPFHHLPVTKERRECKWKSRIFTRPARVNYKCRDCPNCHQARYTVAYAAQRRTKFTW